MCAGNGEGAFPRGLKPADIVGVNVRAKASTLLGLKRVPFNRYIARVFRKLFSPLGGFKARTSRLKPAPFPRPSSGDES